MSFGHSRSVHLSHLMLLHFSRHPRLSKSATNKISRPSPSATWRRWWWSLSTLILSLALSQMNAFHHWILFGTFKRCCDENDTLTSVMVTRVSLCDCERWERVNILLSLSRWPTKVWEWSFTVFGVMKNEKKRTNVCLRLWRWFVNARE